MKTEDFDARIRQKMSQLEPQWDEADWIRLQRKLHPRPKRVVWPWLLLVAALMVSAGLLSLKWKGSEGLLNPHSPPAERPIALQRGASLESAASTETATRSEATHPVMEARHPENGSQPAAARRSYASPRHRKLHGDHDQAGISVKTLSRQGVTSLEELAGAGSAPIGFGESEAVETSSRQTVTAERLPSLELTFPEPSNHLFPPIRIVTLRQPTGWSAGVSALTSGSHWSGGLAAEFRTNKNIVFRSGIQRQTYFDQAFANQTAFKDETDVGFNEIAKPRHSKTEEFSNIRISSADWILPLELRYIYPLSSRAALFVSGGIHLTLKSQTVLTFDYQSYETQEFLRENGLDQESNSATLINHFAFGAGYQRRIMGLDVQLSGVLKTNNSNLPHLKKREVAAQFSVMYPF
ncbi:MAG: hypothetical protein IT266_03630 [Saprospiraceae bacterium]|nr:hypothetical protein [Saprospiraceae bacterium]